MRTVRTARRPTRMPGDTSDRPPRPSHPAGGAGVAATRWRTVLKWTSGVRNRAPVRTSPPRLL
jgi:hypothetical protein